MLKNKKIVVIGGGTGTSVVVSGLKHYQVEITSIVSVADSGGSTGRLRDEFGFQPVGDLRQSLTALAREDSQEWIRNLLLYRFAKSEGLNGHSLGNLILTALQDMTGSTAKALEIAQKIFNISGHIYPVTTKNVELVVEYADGTIKIGEHILDEPMGRQKKIKLVRLSPRAPLYKPAREAIETADLIVIGPGDYYSSVIAALSVDGIKTAFKKSRATVTYILNLMTRFSQTPDLTASGHVSGITAKIGRDVDRVIINSGKIKPEILKRYAADKEYPVEDDLPRKSLQIVRANIARNVPYQPTPADKTPRSLLRHDSAKLAKILTKIASS